MPCDHKVIPLHPPPVQPFDDRGDDALLLLARCGSRDAFDTLVRRYQPFALRVAARYLGQAAAAKDAAQNAFVEVYRALPNYQPRGKFRAYFRKVLVNQCRMAYRRTHRREVVEAWADANPPDISGPDEVLLREQRREIEQAVAMLSEKLRVVVVLRFAGGLTYREIAETLDLPVGTVKSRLFAGLDKLRGALE